MANSIAYRESWIPILDEVYKEGAKSAVLDNSGLVEFDSNGKTIKVPKMSLQGLGTHTRGGSYVSGDVTLTWESITPDYDRDRKFGVDAMDNQETADVAFGMLSGEFIRTKVVPEVDAVRFQKYYADALANSHAATPATLSTGAAVKSALRVGQDAMTNNEVPLEGRILFITTTLLNLVKDLALTESKAILDEFSQIVVVPQSRFYTLITLYDGTTSGQEAGGYIKTASTGADINFLIIHPTAIIQAIKHVAPKYIPASVNQNGDNDEYAYRIYGVNDVFENKQAGVYAHAKAA